MSSRSTDMAAQIAVEIPRHLSSRLFVGVNLPFPRLEPETCVRARICFAVYAGIPRKPKVLSRCIMLGSPRPTQGLILQRIGCTAQSVCTGKCMGVENMS
jgi:hypothetical protein